MFKGMDVNLWNKSHPVSVKEPQHFISIRIEQIYL